MSDRHLIVAEKQHPLGVRRVVPRRGARRALDRLWVPRWEVRMVLKKPTNQDVLDVLRAMMAHEPVIVLLPNSTNGPALKQLAEMWKALYVRELDDGWVITLLRMGFSDRVCLGRIEWSAGYEAGWCYPDRRLARLAAETWDGKNDPIDGWIKEVQSGRCRIDGDPARESIGWPRRDQK